MILQDTCMYSSNTKYNSGKKNSLTLLISSLYTLNCFEKHKFQFTFNVIPQHGEQHRFMIFNVREEKNVLSLHISSTDFFSEVVQGLEGGHCIAIRARRVWGMMGNLECHTVISLQNTSGNICKMICWKGNMCIKNVGPFLSFLMIYFETIWWMNAWHNHKICTWSCCALFCCGYTVVLGEFIWFI